VDWPFLFAALSALTMTVGNLVAVKQNNVKRLLPTPRSPTPDTC